jgi:membrane protein DedA with SNARE-associated domain
VEELVRWLVEDGFGYPLIFALLLGCGYGVPFPEDVPLIAAGVMSVHGGLSVPMASLACAFFVMLRDLSVYYLGRRYGKAILAKPWARKIVTDEAADRFAARIHDNGSKVVFFGRFIMGFRAAVFFAAGLSKVPFRIFVLWDGLALLIFVWAGAAFANQLDKLGIMLHDIRTIAAIVAFLLFGWTSGTFILRWVRDKLREARKEPTGREG